MQPPTAQQLQGLLQQAAGRIRPDVWPRPRPLSWRGILLAQPRHPDALHLLGVIFIQSGDNAKAVELIAQAIAIRSGDPAPYMNIGLALKALGRPEEAIENYDKAIAIKPGYADAWNNRGAALQDLNRPGRSAGQHGTRPARSSPASPKGFK